MIKPCFNLQKSTKEDHCDLHVTEISFFDVKHTAYLFYRALLPGPHRFT